MKDFDDNVPGDTDEEHHHHDVELHPGAQVRGVRVSDDEASTLPQSVVGEGGLFVASEQYTVQPCN